MCVRVNNQLNHRACRFTAMSASVARPFSTNTCIRLITYINGIDIFNNTCYNYASASKS